MGMACPISTDFVAVVVAGYRMHEMGTSRQAAWPHVLTGKQHDFWRQVTPGLCGRAQHGSTCVLLARPTSSSHTCRWSVSTGTDTIHSLNEAMQSLSVVRLVIGSDSCVYQYHGVWIITSMQLHSESEATVALLYAPI